MEIYIIIVILLLFQKGMCRKFIILIFLIMIKFCSASVVHFRAADGLTFYNYFLVSHLIYSTCSIICWYNFNAHRYSTTQFMKQNFTSGQNRPFYTRSNVPLKPVCVINLFHLINYSTYPNQTKHNSKDLSDILKGKTLFYSRLGCF